MLYSRNIHKNALAEGEPKKFRQVWNSLVQPQPKCEICIFLKKKFSKRMHSSRVQTVHCSGHLSCHAAPLPCTPPLPCMPPPTTHAPCLPCTPPSPHMPPFTTHTPFTIHTPLLCTPPLLPCMSPFSTHTPLCHAHPLPPVDRQMLVKHYLSATTVADGKNYQSQYLIMVFIKFTASISWLTTRL